MYLLDTNVVSELRRPKPHGGVLAWLRSVAGVELQVSAMTIGELQAGVEAMRKTAPGKALDIEAWINGLLETYDVLPADSRVFRVWARMLAGKSDDLMEDALIAATADVHGLTVVTRNIRDFLPFGVPTLNPFDHR